VSRSRPSRQADAVVTGAGGGIGRAFAEEIARRGGRVVCADLNLQAAQSTASAITAAGGQALAVACDVAKLADVEALAQRAADWFGGAPTLVINNAGVGLGGSRVEDIRMEDWHWIMGVNLWGVIHGCRVFVPQLRAAGRGAVLNVASAASFGAAPMMGAYNVTKAAVVSLSETLHAELAGTGIRVAVLCPTFVKTDIIRNARMPGTHIGKAQQMMDKQGMTPEKAVCHALDGLDAGTIHLLPQLDARVSWLAKRLAPGLFTRGMGLANRFMPAANESGSGEGKA